MTRDGFAYGITTSQLAIAPGTFVNVANGAHVLRTTIQNFTGGSLYLSGMSMVGTSMAVAGAAMSNVPYTIYGPSPFYLLSGGVTTVVNVIRELSQSYMPIGNQGITLKTETYG